MLEVRKVYEGDPVFCDGAAKWHLNSVYGHYIRQVNGNLQHLTFPIYTEGFFKSYRMFWEHPDY
jgi:hypothetical protein